MKRNKIRITLLVSATFIVMLSAVLVYINQLSRATESSVIAFMDELSEHDRQNIQNELENSLDELSAVYYRTENNKYTTIQDVCRRLNLEHLTNNFDDIYLVDSEGRTYSSANIVQNSSDKSYVRPLLSGDEKFVMRYDNTDYLETLKESIVYGIRCNPFQVNDIKFIGIVGFSKINTIADRLKIDSFDGRGVTSIIDKTGNYVVNYDASAGIGKIDNYFEELQKNTGMSETEIAEIVTQLNQSESSLKHFKYKDHTKQVASFIPMPGTDWSIVLTVDEEAFNEQTQQFVSMTSAMLAVVVAVLCAMMFIIIRVLLISATAKAEAKSRGDFLSNMSHEIRTPLNGIIGLNQLMQQNTQNPKALSEYLHKSDATAKYLLSLVNDVLDMSKLQAGKMALDAKPFSLQQLVSTVATIMRSRMEDKKICFQIETDIRYPEIIGDETRIEQILMNILGNAVKFTPEGGQVTLRALQTNVESGQVTTIFSVEDTGCGISEAFQKKIFNAFSQERNTVSQGTEGTGLGMSISSLLAKQMGGTLSVKSEVGKGSCFTFIIKAGTADSVSDTAPAAEAVPTEVPERGPLNILVAEDNDLNAEILLEMLKASGFTVTHAADGGQVVEQFEASAPYEFDVILMDVQMPVRNGYEATKIIRGLNRPDAKSIIIYACTANSFKEDQDKAFESGMNDFIAKPIDVKKLIQMLGVTK